VLGFLAPQILTFIYGSPMGADSLFRVLLIAMPLDFCFSLLWTVLVSRGYDRFVLYALTTAAVSNVLLNWVFIPRFQAGAAAWATVASYTVLFGMMCCHAALPMRQFRRRPNMRYDLRLPVEADFMGGGDTLSRLSIFQNGGR